MNHTIRELRDMTGLSQKAFAKHFGIPVSTLRKWEQGESSPPSYVIRLLASAIPAQREGLEEIPYKDETSFFFDRVRGVVLDRLGNMIRVEDDLEEVNRHNLGYYIHDLFDDYYLMQHRFDRNCYYDRRNHFVIA